MAITAKMVSELRERTGAGMMDCKKALVAVDGDVEKAIEYLREKGLAAAAKKAGRIAAEGLVETYITEDGSRGAVVELNCETDFVARTDEFKDLAHNIAMQVAACSPQYLTEDEIPQDSDLEPESACLLIQPYIRDPENTVQDIINDTIARVGENIKVSRFARFELGESAQS